MLTTRSMQRNADADQGAGPMMVDPTIYKGSGASQIVICGVILILSAGALMGMRAYGTRSGLSFETVSAESTHTDDADKTAAYDRIMADLARVNKPLDVPLDDMGHSPFFARATSTPDTDTQVATTGTRPLPPMGTVETAEERMDRVRINRKAELINEVSRLELHSVMGGRVPLARINDETVGLNGTVGVFTVVGIEGRSVTLEAEGNRFNLTMDTFGQKGGQKKPAGL